MKRIIVTTAAAACAGLLMAAAPEKARTPEEMEEHLMFTGGPLEKLDAVKGQIAVIDTQSMMTPSNIVAALNLVGDEIRKYDIRILRKKPAPVAELKKESKADIALVIVANDTDPSLLVAPDDHWVVVNVKKCEIGLKTPAAREKFFGSRCRKSLIRGFVAACSSVSSSFPGNIMNVSRIEDMDAYQEFVPFDKFAAMDRYLKDAGLRPRYIKSYRAACREGWAPAPTNKYQKAALESYKEYKAKKDAEKAAKAAKKQSK